MKSGVSLTNNAEMPWLDDRSLCLRPGRLRSKRPGEAAFTLAEVLAALLFMAIVIPVVVQGLRVASMAGEVAERKSQAARVADLVLNEAIATTNWSLASQSGTTIEGTREFRWTVAAEPWSQNMTNQVPFEQSSGNGLLLTGQPTVNQIAVSQTTMNLLTVEVQFMVQGQERTLRLSTLVNPQ